MLGPWPMHLRLVRSAWSICCVPDEATPHCCKLHGNWFWKCNEWRWTLLLERKICKAVTQQCSTVAFNQCVPSQWGAKRYSASDFSNRTPYCCSTSCISAIAHLLAADGAHWKDHEAMQLVGGPISDTANIGSACGPYYVCPILPNFHTQEMMVLVKHILPRHQLVLALTEVQLFP